MKISAHRFYLLVTGCAACWVLPSLGVAQKFFGMLGLAIYVVGAVGLSLLAGLWVTKGLPKYHLPARYFWILNALVLLALLVLFVWLYPRANSGQFGGGSDRDDALNIAVGDLLVGKYPYLQRTYLNAPISPLPGSLFLAIPFVLLGNSAYQNFFWLLVLLLYLAMSWWRTHPQRLALASSLWLFSLLGAPIIMQEFLTGGDMLANGLFVTVFTLMVWQAYQLPGQRWQQWAALLLLGLGIATRFNFACLWAPVALYIAQQRGWRVAGLAVAASVGMALAVSLPFYLLDPAHFSPFHASYIAEQFPSLGAPKLVFAAGLGLATLLGLFWMRGNSRARFLLAAVLPQVVPLLLGLLGFALQHWWQGRFFSYGLSFIWFGTLAIWESWLGAAISN